jgi:hypothetical protein
MGEGKNIALNQLRLIFFAKIISLKYLGIIRKVVKKYEISAASSGVMSTLNFVKRWSTGSKAERKDTHRGSLLFFPKKENKSKTSKQVKMYKP